MTDYTKDVDFAAKDGLAPGNAAKRVLGTELDDEFNEIATASATKEDSVNKGAANGYAPLDGSSDVPDANLPTATEAVRGPLELATQAEAETGTDDFRAMTPLKVEQAQNFWAGENAGMVLDIHALADPGADRILGWDETTNEIIAYTLASPIATNGTALDFDMAGLAQLEGNALAAADEFIVNDGGVNKAIRYQDGGVIVNAAISSVKTFVDEDMNQVHRLSGATDRQWDLDTGVGVGGNFVIFIQTGAGSVDLSAGTATINSAVGNFTRVQDSVIIGLNVGSDVWQFYGDMAAT